MREERSRYDQVQSAHGRQEVKDDKNDPEFMESEAQQDAEKHAKGLEDVDGWEVSE